MEKTKKVGRPKGLKKSPVNIYMEDKRIERLKKFAFKEQKTISIIVENALDIAYGI
jgi:hypothetical protein